MHGLGHSLLPSASEFARFWVPLRFGLATDAIDATKADKVKAVVIVRIFVSLSGLVDESLEAGLLINEGLFGQLLLLFFVKDLQDFFEAEHLKQADVLFP